MLRFKNRSNELVIVWKIDQQLLKLQLIGFSEEPFTLIVFWNTPFHLVVFLLGGIEFGLKNKKKQQKNNKKQIKQQKKTIK